MSTTTYRGRTPKLHLPFSRTAVFGLLIFVALIAFEIFNFSSTEFSLNDLLGDLKFGGLRWATILAIAFCGIDFAGIARLFTPEKGSDEPAEVWYLFGAWLLAAAMNAMLTWWGVSVAIANHQTLGNAVVAQQTLLKVVPIFVALMVWVIRVLIIGTFSVAGETLLWQDASVRSSRKASVAKPSTYSNVSPYSKRPMQPSNRSIAAQSNNYRSAPKPPPQQDPESAFSRSEPTYHNVAVTARPASYRNNNNNTRR